MGWDYNGKMEYQYNFEDGEPQGPQRKYEGDTIVQELYFVDGLLHGTVSWENWLEHLGSEWRSGIRTVRDLDDEGRLEFIRRYTFVPGPRFESGSGKIQFHGETRNLDTYTFSEDGLLVRTRIEGEPDVSFEWYPSGGLRRFSGTRSGSPVGRVMEFHEDGRLFRDEAREGSVRRGPRLIYDRRGRLVQEQQWDHYLNSQVVTVWHTDEIKAAEGNIEHGQGSDSGAKRGEWTYWTPDGRLLRTESYGPGPYSGNRAFIKQMIQYDDQERVEFEGSEKALTLFVYDDDDPDLVRVNRSVKLLDRSRFGVEAWDPESFTIVRAEVKKPTELEPSAQVLEVLGGRALVLSEERFRGDGSRKSVHRWNGTGAPHGLQEGWYRDGSKKYVYEYRRGAFRSGSEWGRDGTSREPQPERRFP
jgi:antitoxin component YwqK of YwqJK toxin-antitoxin module